MWLFDAWKNRKLLLGMNERNLTYVRNYNNSHAKEIADNKLLTKRVLAKASIPTPKLLGAVSNIQELSTFNWENLPQSFVIKPVSGLEGGGIEIFFNRDQQGNWVKADGSRWSLDDIQNLASEILDGKYSLHNQPDQIFFEERIRSHKDFQYYTYKGVPDVRIIVFNMIPIIAYIRIPTKESAGKANLALGAVGAGIDISSGVTTSAIIGKSELIETIPGTKLSVSGIKIPFWDKILEYAVAAQEATKLGFVGVDFLIDRDKGPVVVEMNARPGLSIQIANQDGLRWRLRKAAGIKVQSVKKGIRLAKDLFGGDIEEDIERISGKDLIGISESVVIHDSKKLIETITGEPLPPKYKPVEIKTKAKIDTGADSTSIDEDIATQLGYGPYIELFNNLKVKYGINGDDDHNNPNLDLEEISEKIIAELDKEISLHLDVSTNSIRSSHGRSLRLYVPILLSLGDTTFETMANIFDRSKMDYKIIIGRKSLGKFLIEPSKRSE